MWQSQACITPVGDSLPACVALGTQASSALLQPATTSSQPAVPRLPLDALLQAAKPADPFQANQAAAEAAKSPLPDSDLSENEEPAAAAAKPAGGWSGGAVPPCPALCTHDQACTSW